MNSHPTEMIDSQAIDDVLCDNAQELIKKEAEAVRCLAQRINQDYVHACRLLYHCSGKVVVIGMGKSGHIGRKISATLSSTGTASFFVHAAEALHGDLGMITKNDCVLALSNSGETPEVISLLPSFKKKNIPIISLTGQPQSTLARAADVNLDASVSAEACPLGLAPTTSTTVALVMGDALAVSLLQARGFTPQDFAQSHPQGHLGRRLTITVNDLMSQHEHIPMVHQEQPITEVILEMTSKHLGMTTVVHGEQLCGIITDGDLRRYWNQHHDWHTQQPLAKDIMSTTFKSVSPDMLAVDALALCHQRKITSLVILDHQDRCQGVIHIHHLLNAKLT